MKVQKMITIDIDIAEVVQERHLNLSQICNEALKAVISQESPEGATQQNALGKMLLHQAAKKKDAEILKRIRNNYLKNPHTGGEKYSKALQIFAEKFSLTIEEAVQYAEGRR